MVVWKSRKAGGFSSCLSTLPGRSRQVLSAPFGKLRRFCPIYDFSSDNSAASRSCLQADTGVIRLQPYLRQTSLNFPKWEMLSFVQHFTVTEVKLVFSHIACSPEAIWEEMHNKKSTSYEMLILFSNFLSSQIASNQVLSAFTSLTSVFGMGTGVSSQLLPPYLKVVPSKLYRSITEALGFGRVVKS